MVGTHHYARTGRKRRVVPEVRLAVDGGELRTRDVVAEGGEGNGADRDDVGGLDEGDLSAHPLATDVDVGLVGSGVWKTLNSVDERTLGWVDTGLAEEVLESDPGRTDEGFSCCRFRTTGRFTDDAELGPDVTPPGNGRRSFVERTESAGAKAVSER